MEVTLYMDDSDEHGIQTIWSQRVSWKPTSLSGWAAHVKWCCRINAAAYATSLSFDDSFTGGGRPADTGATGQRPQWLVVAI